MFEAILVFRILIYWLWLIFGVWFVSGITCNLLGNTDPKTFEKVFSLLGIMLTILLLINN